MNKIITIALITTLLSLSACIEVKHPQNANDFRKAVPGAFMSKVESYVVNRSFRQVANVFKKRAKMCLDKTTRTESRTHMSYQVIVTNYNPTVKIRKNKAELHLQQMHEKGVMNVSKQPSKGYYLMVFDAEPVSKKKTKITYYGPSSGFDQIRTAVKNWSSGKNTQCPDMTKF